MSLLKLRFDCSFCISQEKSTHLLLTRYIYIFPSDFAPPGCSLQQKAVCLHPMWLALPWCILAIVVQCGAAVVSHWCLTNGTDCSCCVLDLRQPWNNKRIKRRPSYDRRLMNATLHRTESIKIQQTCGTNVVECWDLATTSTPLWWLIYLLTD